MARTDFIPDDVHTKYGYDPNTGIFVWLVARDIGKGNFDESYIGQEAGSMVHGYNKLWYGKTYYHAHRIAWYLYYGEWLDPKQHLDHINGNRCDNRISNLRKVSKSQNVMNSETRSDNTSGWRGVIWDKRSGKWVANIVIDGKRKWLGRFIDKDEAIKVRKNAEKKTFGEFSYFERENHEDG